jgi:hypothetical protein
MIVIWIIRFESVNRPNLFIIQLPFKMQELFALIAFSEQEREKGFDKLSPLIQISLSITYIPPYIGGFDTSRLM